VRKPQFIGGMPSFAEWRQAEPERGPPRTAANRVSRT
jgi:hypothetical protein